MHSDTPHPIVSFVVPVYNVAPYVEKCLTSILGQTVSRIEVLVVNDGSTDGGGKICDQIALLDRRVSVTHTSNHGVSHARNMGMDQASGDYVCFIDSDDWLSPVFAERMIGWMEESGSPIATCGPTRVADDGTVRWRHSCCHVVMDKENALCGVLRRDLYCGWPWNKMFRLSFLREHKIRYDESLRWTEDIVFCFDAVRHSQSVVYDSTQDLYFYRENPTSINQLMHRKGAFDMRYLIRLRADEILLDWAKEISPKVIRYAKANAFISNENIFRRLVQLGAPNKKVVRAVAHNMYRHILFVLTCRGFGRIPTKIRFVFETIRALSGLIPVKKDALS